MYALKTQLSNEQEYQTDEKNRLFTNTDRITFRLRSNRKAH